MDSPISPVIKEVSGLLGLEVRQGQEAIDVAASTKLFTEADKLGRDAVQKIEGYQQELERTRGMLATLGKYLPLEARLNQLHAAMGTLDGDTLFLVPEVRQDVTTLHVALMFGSPQDLTLYLYPQKWYHALGSIVGLQDIQVGDAHLDPLVIVQASDVHKAQLLLSKPAVSQSLLQLYSHPSLEPIVNDLSVRCVIRGLPSSEDVVGSVKLMQRVSQAFRDSG